MAQTCFGALGPAAAARRAPGARAQAGQLGRRAAARRAAPALPEARLQLPVRPGAAMRAWAAAQQPATEPLSAMDQQPPTCSPTVLIVSMLQLGR